MSASLVFALQESCPLGHAHAGSWLRPFAFAAGSGPFQADTFKILQCSVCGLGVTSPIPTRDTAAALYSERSSNDFQPNESGLSARLKAWFAKRDAQTFARHASHPKAILDYGCGNGEFSSAFASLYPHAQVVGADFHPTAPPMLSGSGAYVPMHDLPRHTGRFDLVIARHVLEHTYDPVETLTTLKSLLAPGGSLVIEVPCLGGGAQRLFGKHWAAYYAPYHPIHFTRESLTLAFESAGCAVVEHGNAELPMIGRSLQNTLRCDYNVGLFGLGALLQPLQLAMSALTGKPTALRVWAKRQED